MEKPVLLKTAAARVALACRLTLALAFWAGIAHAQSPTVTLLTSAADPVHGPFSVAAQFSAQVTTFTASRLKLSNATAGGMKAQTVQKPMSGGDLHSLVLKADGTVAAWGYSYFGQCNVPTGLAGVAAIDAGGDDHSLALKADGTVVAWGNNRDGQCNVPAGLAGVTAIAAGIGYSMALKADGTVAAWGSNTDGERNVPAGLAGVIAIDAGVKHSLALKADGTVVAWGWNFEGQCNIPAGLAGVVAIAAGDHHGLALKADGTLIAWGYNDGGQCNVPVGLKAALPKSSCCMFDVNPLTPGLVTVQLPAGAVPALLGGAGNLASNILKRTYGLVPVTLSRFAAD